jgi:hypothetical protein
MPILNYTTTITVDKTVGEIQQILGKAGARSVIVDYANRQPEAISFQVEVNERLVSFRLPSRWQGVWKALQSEPVERKYKTEDQARRTAWRIIKDWTEAQIAIIQAGQAELVEVFLPYMLHPGTGQTMYQQFRAGYLLEPGGEG